MQVDLRLSRWVLGMRKTRSGTSNIAAGTCHDNTNSSKNWIFHLKCYIAKNSFKTVLKYL